MSPLVRAVRTLLRTTLGDAPAAESIVGDLDEEFAASPPGLRRDLGYTWCALRLTAEYGLWRRVRQVRVPVPRKLAPAGVGLDLRQALRTLARRPTYLAAGVATLALGIGAGTAIFSVVWHSLLRPLPFAASDRLIVLYDRPLDRPDAMSNMNVATFLELRERTRAFEALSAFEYGSFLVGGGLEPAHVTGLRVNAGFFGLLRLPPRLGRDFRDEDDRPEAEPVVILSYGLWRERFGADPDIIGRTVLVDLVPRVVVGVASPDVTWRAAPQVWVPWAWDDVVRTDRRRRSIFAIGRIAGGVAPNAATAELAAIFADIRSRHPEFNESRTIDGMALAEWSIGWGRRLMVMLAGAAALALLVACANAASLMLARAAGRRSEIALRRALGAGRYRAARVFLAESLILSVMGAALGIAVARAGVHLILSLWGAAIPRADEVAVNAAALAFACGTALVIALLVGLVPVVAADGGSAAARLRASGQGAVRRSDRLQSALVVIEVALGIVLVSAAGLLAHTAARLARVDLGIEERGALSFRVTLPAARYATPVSAAAFFSAFVADLSALPGVSAAGLSTRSPLSGGTNGHFVTAADPGREHLVEMRGVTPGWFAATGQRLRAGRPLTEADARSGSNVVVVNESLARTLFPDGDALGRELRATWLEGEWTIAAVVSDVRDYGPAREPAPTAYWPFGGEMLHSTSMSVLVRTVHRDPRALLPVVRDRLRARDPDLPMADVATLESLAARTLGRERTAALALIGAFAALSLVLALLGIYAVIALVVEERRREVGVRMALGATRTSIVRMVCVRGLRLAALGILFGLAGALVAGRLVAHLLWNVSPIDPLALGGTVALFALAALAGAALPARRAACVAVADVLRQE